MRHSNKKPHSAIPPKKGSHIEMYAFVYMRKEGMLEKVGDKIIQGGKPSQIAEKENTEIK